MDQNTPQQYLGNQSFIFISCGGCHTIGITSKLIFDISLFIFFNYVENGELFSWGLNYYGQLGLGDNTRRKTPSKISPFTNQSIRSISCGDCHSVVLTGKIIDYDYYCESHSILKRKRHTIKNIQIR